MNGKELFDILLHKYHLQMEMEAPTYVLAITSFMDTKEGFKRLAEALIQIDQELQDKEYNKKLCSIQKAFGAFIQIEEKFTIFVL